MKISNINKISCVNPVNYCKPVYSHKCKPEFTVIDSLNDWISVQIKSNCKPLQEVTRVYINHN